MSPPLLSPIFSSHQEREGTGTSTGFGMAEWVRKRIKMGMEKTVRKGKEKKKGSLQRRQSWK